MINLTVQSKMVGFFKSKWYLTPCSEGPEVGSGAGKDVRELRITRHRHGNIINKDLMGSLHR